MLYGVDTGWVWLAWIWTSSPVGQWTALRIEMLASTNSTFRNDGDFRSADSMSHRARWPALRALGRVALGPRESGSFSNAKMERRRSKSDVGVARLVL